MKNIFFCSLLSFVFGYQNLYAQCDYITPPSVKKIKYAAREVTFSDVIMNGKQTTYLAVQPGETVKIKANISAKQSGDYCPSCIVQVYWGIRGFTSVCAQSFYGYQFNQKATSHKFKAPVKEGIYYITMGGTLDYSCKNNINRPVCSPNDAFAVLKVGNPDPEKKVTLTKITKGSSPFLKTTLDKEGCFGGLDQIEWFLDGKKLAQGNQKEIPLTQYGNYRVMWSNCLDSVAKSYSHTNKASKSLSLIANPSAPLSEEKSNQLVLTLKPASQNNPTNEKITPTLTLVQPKGANETIDIEQLIEENDKFVLEHLIFDLSKSDIKPEAQKELNKLAEIMRENPSMSILLEGHTDNRGSSRKNQVLSEKRVKSTKAYLVSQEVNKDRIAVKGWGDKKPLIITLDVEEGKINRRVEISILSR